MARIVVRLGSKTVRVVALDLPLVTVGRGSGAQIALDDPLVGREHCRLRATGDGHVLVDLKSRTGTFLNDRPLDGSRTLEPGDEIGVGKHTLIYEYGEARSGAEPTQAASDDRPAAGLGAGLEDFQGTLLASTDEVARARELAAVLQQPHLKFRHRGSTRHAPIEDGFEVGYTRQADFVLEGARMLGRRQFRVLPTERGHAVEVLSFWAQVRVNGERVRGSARLRDGARIQAGGTTFVFGAGD